MKTIDKKVKLENAPTVEDIYSMLMFQLKTVRVSWHEGHDSYLGARTHFEDDHHTSRTAGLRYREFDFAKLGDAHWIFSKSDTWGHLAGAYRSDILAIQTSGKSLNIWKWGDVLEFVSENWEWHKNRRPLDYNDVYDFSSSVLVQMEDGSLAVSETSPFHRIGEKVQALLRMYEVDKEGTTLNTTDYDRVSPNLKILLPSEIPVRTSNALFAIVDAIKENLASIEAK